MISVTRFGAVKQVHHFHQIASNRTYIGASNLIGGVESAAERRPQPVSQAKRFPQESDLNSPHPQNIWNLSGGVYTYMGLTTILINSIPTFFFPQTAIRL